MKKKTVSDCNCTPESGGCTPGKSGIERREFLKSTAMGAAMMALPGLPLFAGPFDENDYLKYIPADKKLDPKWVASLYSRGVKEIYSQPKALNHS